MTHRSRIFINYRREDTEHLVGRLAERLRGEFGPAQIFEDAASIEPGVDFADALRHGLQTCAAVLVVIGPRWLTVAKGAPGPRLNDPDDWVAYEISESLKQPDVRVFPVLVDATMPNGDELPESVRPLIRRQAFVLTRHHWDADVATLIGHLRRVPGLGVNATALGATLPRGELGALDHRSGPAVKPAAPAELGRRDAQRTRVSTLGHKSRLSSLRSAAVIATIVLVIIGGGISWWLGSHQTDPTTTKTTVPIDPPAPTADAPVASRQEPSPTAGQPKTVPSQQPAAATSVPAATIPAAQDPVTQTSIPGTWRGTLTFYTTVTPISIRFGDDLTMDLTSPRGTVASGTWSRSANDTIVVDARHRQLGAFACDLKTTNAAITGRCTASGNYAGDIALLDRGTVNP